MIDNYLFINPVFKIFLNRFLSLYFFKDYFMSLALVIPVYAQICNCVTENSGCLSFVSQVYHCRAFL